METRDLGPGAVAGSGSVRAESIAGRDAFSVEHLALLVQRGEADEHIRATILLKLLERVIALEAATATLTAELAQSSAWWRERALAQDAYWRGLAADVRGNGKVGLKELVRLNLRVLVVLSVSMLGLFGLFLLLARHVGL